MSEFATSLSASASALRAQASRLRLVSENISNADTPGYRRKVAPFETTATGPGGTPAVSVGDVRLDQSDLTRVYDPGHPMADASGYFQGSNVDLMIEIADAREAQRSYEANLKMFDQARQMSTALLDLLRR